MSALLPAVAAIGQPEPRLPRNEIRLGYVVGMAFGHGRDQLTDVDRIDDGATANSGTCGGIPCGEIAIGQGPMVRVR